MEMNGPKNWEHVNKENSFKFESYDMMAARNKNVILIVRNSVIVTITTKPHGTHFNER